MTCRRSIACELACIEKPYKCFHAGLVCFRSQKCIGDTIFRELGNRHVQLIGNESEKCLVEFLIKGSI